MCLPGDRGQYPALAVPPAASRASPAVPPTLPGSALCSAAPAIAGPEPGLRSGGRVLARPTYSDPAVITPAAGASWHGRLSAAIGRPCPTRQHGLSLRPELYERYRKTRRMSSEAARASDRLRGKPCRGGGVDRAPGWAMLRHLAQTRGQGSARHVHAAATGGRIAAWRSMVLA